jgi:hypothetical protein
VGTEAQEVTPIVVTKPAVLGRIADLLRQREQLDLVLNVTIRTMADMYDVPEGWQYDPSAGAFIPTRQAEEPAGEPA